MKDNTNLLGVCFIMFTFSEKVDHIFDIVLLHPYDPEVPVFNILTQDTSSEDMWKISENLKRNLECGFITRLFLSVFHKANGFLKRL